MERRGSDGRAPADPHEIQKQQCGGIGLEAMDDGAVIPFCGKNLVFTTDSHVVRPIFFPAVISAESLSAGLLTILQ